MNEYIIEELSELVKKFETGDSEKKSQSLQKMYIYYGLSAHAFYIDALKGEDVILALEALE